MTENYLPQFINAMTSNGSSTEYIFDRYDIEVRPLDRNIPGQQTVGGYQYRFRSQSGYLTFLFDQNLMNAAGLNRTWGEYYSAMTAGGMMDLPEGYTFGYDEVTGKPGFFGSLLLRQRPIPMPKEDEMEYRAMKESIRKMNEKNKKYQK